VGYTCEQFTSYKKSIHCRFCGESVTNKNQAPRKNFAPTLQEVCNNPECLEKREISCDKILSCNHYCCGMKDEEICLKCLHEDCTVGHNQNGFSYCSICWTDYLQSSPSVELQCGHLFHFQCVNRLLNQKWQSSNITFGFMDCPLCNTRMNHVSLRSELDPLLELYENIKTKAMTRLQHLKLEGAKEIVEPGEIFYNNPVGYAMKRFCYYLCFKCKKPYFGGERACNAEQRVGEFNLEELICGTCCNTGNQENCKNHGNEYIEWKCKFCCKTANWYCWGTTHFCEECHQQASNIARKPRNELPLCNCGVNHPPNGEEYCFGCTLCKLERSIDF